MSDFRVDRLIAVPGLAGRYSVLDPKAASDIHAALWLRGLTAPDHLAKLSALTTEAGSALLASIDIAPTTTVWVSYSDDGWVDAAGSAAQHLVLLTDWAAFTQFWNDFWYPSSDDIRVAATDDRSRIVEINHEEELREIASRP